MLDKIAKKLAIMDVVDTFLGTCPEFEAYLEEDCLKIGESLIGNTSNDVTKRVRIGVDVFDITIKSVG